MNPPEQSAPSCITCHYSLAGLPSERTSCPECGCPIAWTTAQGYLIVAPRGYQWRLAGGAALLLAAGWLLLAASAFWSGASPGAGYYPLVDWLLLGFGAVAAVGGLLLTGQPPDPHHPAADAVERQVARVALITLAAPIVPLLAAVGETPLPWLITQVFRSLPVFAVPIPLTLLVSVLLAAEPRRLRLLTRGAAGLWLVLYGLLIVYTILANSAILTGLLTTLFVVTVLLYLVLLLVWTIQFLVLFAQAVPVSPRARHESPPAT
jgi:hypothetical protein